MTDQCCTDQHDTVFWEDYYGARFRMCRLCNLLEVESAKGWIAKDRIAQHDARAMWTALREQMRKEVT